jgi:hypothetical protein
MLPFINIPLLTRLPGELANLSFFSKFDGKNLVFVSKYYLLMGSKFYLLSK